MGQQKSGHHARAARASAGHIINYILITLEQLLWRALCLSPFIYALVSGSFFGLQKDYLVPVSLLCCIPLWILLVLPARFRVGAQLSAWFGTDIEKSSWASRLLRGLRRLLISLPFVLPLAAYVAVIYYNMYYVGFNSFFALIESAGKIVGGNFVAGVAVLAALFVILTIVAFWGWRRFMMPYFYLPEGERAKARASAPLGKTIAINFLIILPPLGIVLALLALSLAPKLSGSMMYDTLTIVSAVTQFSFPSQALVQSAWVLGLAYVPFVLLRKAAIASRLSEGK